MSLLSIILINYKGAPDTVRCVESLRKSTFRDFEIIIVDNNSGDGSIETIRRECPESILLAQPENIGFAAGSNLGIKLALERKNDFILLLNNDTLVRPESLEVLMRTMKEREDIGVLGGKIYYVDRPTTFWYAGGNLNLNSGYGYHSGLNEEDRGQFDTARDVDFVTGCYLLTRRTVIEKVGMLDERYFAYYEDSDFCLRARKAGYKIWYEPRSVIYHKAHTTVGWDSPFFVYFLFRNKILFLKKHRKFWNWFPFLPAIVYFYGRQFIRLIFKWHNYPSARAAWLAIIDGLRGNVGEYGRGRLNQLRVRK